MRIKVYVAGPYAKGDQIVNTRDAVLAAKELWDAGFAPYCPHLTAFFHFLTPMSHDDWLEFDKEWVPTCHAVLQLPGESSGADGEVELAQSLSIPVFHSIAALKKHYAGINRVA